MKVSFTQIDTTYACAELAHGLRSAIPAVRQLGREYESRPDERELVMVLLCPCCARDEKLDTPGAVLVSPFKGVDPDGYVLHRAEQYPPFRTPGANEEAGSVEEYIAGLRSIVDQALATSNG